MPLTLPNTTLNLSTVDQLREIVVQTNDILGTTIDPFTLENLNKSEWWQYEFARQVLSTTLVNEGYPALPDFTISDLNNGKLPIVLIQNINTSLLGGGSSSFLLEPIGANQTSDGNLQQLSYDGVSTFGVDSGGVPTVVAGWYAEVSQINRPAEYVFNLKMPDLPVDGRVAITVVERGFESSDVVEAPTQSHVLLEIGGTGDLILSVLDNNNPANNANLSVPRPLVGDEIQLIVSTFIVQYISGGTTQSKNLSFGLFQTNPNAIVTSTGAIVPTVSVLASPYFEF